MLTLVLFSTVIVTYILFTFDSLESEPVRVSAERHQRRQPK
jgi:hypothetical protein